MLRYLTYSKISSLQTRINIVFDEAGQSELDLLNTPKKHAHRIYNQLKAYRGQIDKSEVKLEVSSI